MLPLDYEQYLRLIDTLSLLLKEYQQTSRRAAFGTYTLHSSERILRADQVLLKHLILHLIQYLQMFPWAGAQFLSNIPRVFLSRQIDMYTPLLFK
jgi:hypothetical protein